MTTAAAVVARGYFTNVTSILARWATLVAIEPRMGLPIAPRFGVPLKIAGETRVNHRSGRRTPHGVARDDDVASYSKLSASRSGTQPSLRAKSSYPKRRTTR